MLHLIAMAKAINVDVSLNDFQMISDRTPFIADLRPSGRFCDHNNDNLFL